MSNLYLLSDKIKDLTQLKNFKMGKIASLLKMLQHRIELNFKNDRLLQQCVSGTLKLEFLTAGSDVPIDGPNSAAVGTFKKSVGFSVKTNQNEVVHLLNGIKPTITLSKVGAGFNNPTIFPAEPVIQKGACKFDLIYTTDSGVTEIYAPGDSVSVAVDISICGISLTQISLSDNLIA